MEWRRLCIDSRHRTADSASNSDFWVDLKYSTNVFKGFTMHIDGVSLSHSWSTVDRDVNDILYVGELDGDYPSNGQIWHRKITITPGNYNAETLRAELELKLNAPCVQGVTDNGTHLPGTYPVTLEDGKLTIGHGGVADNTASSQRAVIYGKNYIDDGYMKSIWGGEYSPATTTET